MYSVIMIIKYRLSELEKVLKDIKNRPGNPLPSQNQHSVEKSNQDIENMLYTWILD